MTQQFNFLDERPIAICLAGSNGAGKSTFHARFLAESGLCFVNADQFGKESGLAPYEAARLAKAVRRHLVLRRESFILETVFSDPVGDKLNEFRELTTIGYTVVLIFISIDDPKESFRRVRMRVAQGGHDVPEDKILSRFSRTRHNLAIAIPCLPHVLVFDNQDIDNPFQLVARYHNGQSIEI